MCCFSVMGFHAGWYSCALDRTAGVGVVLYCPALRVCLPAASMFVALGSLLRLRITFWQVTQAQRVHVYTRSRWRLYVLISLRR